MGKLKINTTYNYIKVFEYEYHTAIHITIADEEEKIAYGAENIMKNC